MVLRQAMIIVGPDDVVIPDQGTQAIGEYPVDSEVTARVGAGILQEIRTR